MWPNPQFPVDLVIFTEEILNGKLHFLYSVKSSFVAKRYPLTLLVELYGPDRNDRIARQRLKGRLQIIFPELLFLSYSKNIPQIIIANINNISCTDFILSSKEKMFRFVTDNLRTDIQNMMQAAPSLPWPIKPEDLFAPDRQPPKSVTSFLEQFL